LVLPPRVDEDEVPNRFEDVRACVGVNHDTDQVLWEKQHRETGSDLLFHVKAD
jgi:hypothetical protein